MVQTVVWTPQDPSGRERELLEELGNLERKRAASEGKSLFDRMRQAFTDSAG